MPEQAFNPRVHPFACGSQAHDWQDRNCYRCAKFDATKSPASECEVVVALAAAWWDDGSVSAEIAQRMGHRGSEDAHTWDCPEREFPKAKGADDEVP